MGLMPLTGGYMSLDTVADYIARCRTQLQDLIPPYRHLDEDLVEYLNSSIQVARGIRPDLMMAFFRSNLPEFTTANMTAAVPIDPMYRPPFIYYICGQAQLEDQEDTEDPRAIALITKFSTQLVSGQG